MSIDSPEFNKEVLSNGITILHERRKVPAATTLVATRFGAMHEPTAKKGIAHFIEHMLFKGTKRRSAKDIREDIQRVGGLFNAFTGDQRTAIYTKMPKKHLARALDVSFDMAYNSVFDKKETGRERAVIFEEIKRNRDDPIKFVYNSMKNNLYAAPFGLSVVGSEESLSSVTRRDLLDYYRYYSANNLIISTVADIPFEEIKEMVCAMKVPHTKRILPRVRVVPKMSDSTTFKKGIQQAHIGIGYYMPDSMHKNSYAARVFNCILGVGMSSKLFQEIREKHGLAYSVGSSLNQCKGYSYGTIYAGTKKESLKQVRELALKQVKSIQDTNAKDLEVMKEELIGKHEVICESSDYVAGGLLTHELDSKAGDLYAYPEKISDVKLSQVKEVARIRKCNTIMLCPE